MCIDSVTIFFTFATTYLDSLLIDLFTTQYKNNSKTAGEKYTIS